jgi:hypothetical protein
MVLRGLLCALVLLGLPAPGALAAEPEPIESLVIKLASTPEQHRAVAEYYRAQAEAAREEAQRHRAMAAGYGGTKLAEREHMRAHCEKIAAGQEATAKEYEALAAVHDAEAKKAP